MDQGKVLIFLNALIHLHKIEDFITDSVIDDGAKSALSCLNFHDTITPCNAVDTRLLDILERAMNQKNLWIALITLIVAIFVFAQVYIL